MIFPKGEKLYKPLKRFFREHKKNETLFISGSQRGAVNVRLLREFCLVEKLLTILKKGDCSNPTTLTLLNVVHGLLCANPRVTDVLCFALFTAATLNTTTQSERRVDLKPGSDGTEEIDEGDKKQSRNFNSFCFTTKSNYLIFVVISSYSIG